MAEQSSCALKETRMKDECQQTFCEIGESEVGVRKHMVKMEGLGQLEGRWELFLNFVGQEELKCYSTFRGAH